MFKLYQIHKGNKKNIVEQEAVTEEEIEHRSYKTRKKKEQNDSTLAVI